MMDKDREDLIEFKKQLDAVAKKAQDLFSRGFILEFNVNIATGVADNYKVAQRVEVDLSQLGRKPS